MEGWICLGIYIIGIVLYVIVGSKLFKPIDGYYEIHNGEAYEIDEDEQRSDMIARAFFWPIVVTLLIIASPIILMDKLSEKIVNENREN